MKAESHTTKAALRISLIVMAGVIIVGLILFRLVNDNVADNPTVKPTYRIDSKDLKRTVITPHLEHEIRAGENVLYCSTFQLAWNELRDNITKERVQLGVEPPVVAYLNKGLSTKADIAEEDYFVTAGLAKDNIIQKINNTLKAKFNGQVPLLQEMLERPDDLIVFAFLNKNMKFAKEFESLYSPVVFNSDGESVGVKAFGIAKYSKEYHSDIGKQVEIYIGRHSQIAKLKPASLGDEIILAKVKHERTLLGTIEAVESHIANGNRLDLGGLDSLEIPKFNFDITHSYAELLNKNLKNKGFEDYRITGAIQTILFRLDEKGAVLRSSGTIRMTLGRKISLIFDGPFLMYLKEKDGRYPYFAMWVDNSELMIKK